MPEGIGEELRRRRLAAGIELEEVEARTKIRVRYLRALEAEDWDVLPAEAYAHGFLRTYAGFLGLDAEDVLDRYRRERRPPAEAPLEPAPLPARPPSGAGRVLGLIAAGIALVAGVLIVIGLIAGGTDSGPASVATAPHAPQKPKRRHQQTTTTTASRLTVSVRADADVWVCLVDESGKRLIDGQVLPAGASRGPYTAAGMMLSLGNGSARVQVNGDAISIPSSPNPLGYTLTPTAVSRLSEAQRPTCT